MAYTNTIGILIAAKDEASAIIQKAAAQTKVASGEVNALGGVSNATGALLKGSLVVGLIAAAGQSANLAIQFQQHMEMLHTNAGVAQSAIAGLSTQILNMSASVGQGPDALAQAFYHIASAGTGIWTTAQQLDILKSAAEGAAIGQASLDDTTYALTSAMSSNVGGVKNAAEMMAVLNATVGAGDMKLQDLNGALSTGILSTAATFGISIQSVGAALATLTDNGEHADEAATRLRMTFALMASPSGAATKQLEALGLTAEDAKKSTEGMNAVFAKSGLSTTKLADDLRQPNGITAAMKDLKTHLEDAGLSASETDAMLSKAFGGGRTDAALLTMLQNIDRMDAKFKAINTTAGDFAQNYAAQQETAAQRIKDVWAGTQAVMIRFGDYLGAIADQAMKVLAPAFKNFGDVWTKYVQPGFDQFAKDLGPALLKILGGALGAAILVVMASLLALGEALSATAQAFDGLVKGANVAIKWLVANVPKAIKEVTDYFTKMGRDMKRDWDGMNKDIENFWNAAHKSFQDGINAVVNFMNHLPEEIGYAVGVTARVLMGFALQVVPDFFNAVVSWFSRLPGEIGHWLSSVWQTVVGWFSKTADDGQKGAQDIVNRSTQAVASLPGSFASAVAGIWDAVVNAFNSFKNNSVNWARDTVNSIVSEFTNLPGRLTSAVGGAINGVDQSFNKAVSNGYNQFVSGLSKGFGAHALGTNFTSGGLAVVGENGPEIVNLPRGASVASNADSRKMTSQGGGTGITINGGMHIHNEMDEQRFLANLGWRLALR